MANRRHYPPTAFRLRNSMAYQQLIVESTDRITTITVNRPDKLNALDDATIIELGQAMDEARADDAVSGVIVTGAGRSFVAGADIGELRTQDVTSARRRSLAGQAVFGRFESSPKPVIAAVNGFALGGGCELAMACHFRIASETAKFGQPEVKLGIVAGYGGTQRLPRLVGPGLAMQLLLTGEIIDAARALQIGLVNEVVPGVDLMERVRSIMGQILANGPLAVAHTIELVNQGTGLPLGDALAMEASHFGLLSASDDMREGMAAFLEKRPADFTGR